MYRNLYFSKQVRNVEMADHEMESRPVSTRAISLAGVVLAGVIMGKSSAPAIIGHLHSQPRSRYLRGCSCRGCSRRRS